MRLKGNVKKQLMWVGAKEVYGNSLNYLLNFSVKLKLFKKGKPPWKKEISTINMEKNKSGETNRDLLLINHINVCNIIWNLKIQEG